MKAGAEGRTTPDWRANSFLHLPFVLELTNS